MNVKIKPTTATTTPTATTLPDHSSAPANPDTQEMEKCAKVTKLGCDAIDMLFIMMLYNAFIAL